MSAAGLRCLVLALALGACRGGDARSLLEIDVHAPDGAGITTVQIDVHQGGAVVKSRTFDWTAPAGSPLEVGIYDVVGALEASAIAVVGATRYVAPPARASVARGERGSLILRLAREAAPPAPDAAPPEAGDAGAPPEPIAEAGAPETAAEIGVEAPAPIERAWGRAENIENDLLSKSYATELAVDRASGDVLLTWYEDAGPVKAQRYDARTSTWAAPVVVTEAGRPSYPRVAFARNGHAIITWYDSDSTDQAARGIHVSASTDGGRTWSKPHRLAPQLYYLLVPLPVIAANGDARVVWGEGMNGVYRVVTAGYRAASATWSAPEIVSGGSDSAESPQIAGDDSGAGIITFTQSYSVWAATFDASAVQPAQLVESDAENVYHPTPAMDPKGGRGVVIWSSLRGDLWLNQHAAGAWKGPARAVAGASASLPAAVVDETGALTVAWAASSASGRYNVAAARQPAPGAAWSAPTPLESDNHATGKDYDLPAPALAADARGNVHVAWRRRLEGTTGFAAVTRSLVGGSWTPETVLGAKPGLRTNHPVLGVSGAGVAVAAFYFWGDVVDTSLYNNFVAFYR